MLLRKIITLPILTPTPTSIPPVQTIEVEENYPEIKKTEVNMEIKKIKKPRKPRKPKNKKDN